MPSNRPRSNQGIQFRPQPLQGGSFPNRFQNGLKHLVVQQFINVSQQL